MILAAIFLVIFLLYIVYRFTYGRDQVGGGASQGECRFYGSDEEDGWVCPAEFPHYNGSSIGHNCSAGVSDNTNCKGVVGSGAVANLIVEEGVIVGAQIIDGGQNYIYPPKITITDEGSGYGAVLISGVNNGAVTDIDVVYGGTDYKKPSIEFETVDSGTGATAKADISDGKVTAVHILNTGSNYSVPPRISFQNSDGNGASATAKINQGRIVSVELTSGGTGYTLEPNVYIEAGKISTGCKFCHMCCKKSKETETEAVVEEDDADAEEYDQVLEEELEFMQKKADEAAEKWDKMKKELEEEEELIEQAKELGLPPPPKLYSDKQIENVQKEMVVEKPVMTKKEKAKCMRLKRKADKARDLAEQYGMNADDVDSPSSKKARKYGREADKAWTEYRKQCKKRS